jgi:hypothetical protein
VLVLVVVLVIEQFPIDYDYEDEDDDVNENESGRQTFSIHSQGDLLRKTKTASCQPVGLVKDRRPVRG